MQNGQVSSAILPKVIISSLIKSTPVLLFFCYNSGLMEKDSWENLGLQGVEEANANSTTPPVKPKSKHPAQQ